MGRDQGAYYYISRPRPQLLMHPQDPIKDNFDGRAPFIKYSRGDDFGFVGFHKALTEDEITKVKEAIKTINSKPVTWTIPTGALSLYSTTLPIH